ncbi:MAG: DEAD/DEAH box helicase [Burkholderiales bacterium]|nr:DEAD/DEAH box helicase [Burkholderiales bacterium]
MTELLGAVEAQGYIQPTPIQLKAIPPVLEGRDLLAAAQTGTGKTAGFVLPLLQRLRTIKSKGSPDGRRPPRCLILTPTRELAAQVEESVKAYGANLNVQSTVVFGGVGIQPQVQALRRGVEILVATPGRLLDHVQQKTVDLSRIEILVLDEADRMLDMGFIRDIRRILALLPKERQNLLFSATFAPEIRELAHDFLQDPVTVEVAPRNSASELVSQVVYPVDQARKRELLAQLINAGAWKQVLVFTRTKHGANRLAQQLERDGISADAIHGNKSQSHRTRTLADFKKGDLRVLVATDIAARGLDIEELPHVVNFDLSHVAEDYVHRIGRTGRAGSEGEAISLVSPDENSLLAAIERLIKRGIERRIEPGFEVSARGAAAPVEQDDRPARGRSGQPRRGDATRPNESRRSNEPRRSEASGRGNTPRRSAPGGQRQGERSQGEQSRPGPGGQRPPSGNADGNRSGQRQGEQRATGNAGARRASGSAGQGTANRNGGNRRGGERSAEPKRQQAAQSRSSGGERGREQRDQAPDGNKRGTFASLFATARRLIG